MWKIVACGDRNPGLWNPKYSSRNLEYALQLESRIQVPLTWIRNPQRGVQNPRRSWMTLQGVVGGDWITPNNLIPLVSSLWKLFSRGRSGWFWCWRRRPHWILSKNSLSRRLRGRFFLSLFLFVRWFGRFWLKQVLNFIAFLSWTGYNSQTSRKVRLFQVLFRKKLHNITTIVQGV